MKTSGFEAAPERKRKRPHPDQHNLRQLNSGDSSDGKTTSGSSEEAAKDATTKPSLPQPKDEEVEEFFAILRRMHASVKYVGNSANSDGNGKMRWTALDAGLPFPAPSTNGGKRKVKKEEPKVGGKAKNCVSFDLNAVPAEAAEANGD